MVSAEGYASQAEPISLSADVTRDFVLQDTAVATGLVLTARGEPAVRASVRGSVGASTPGGGVAVETMTDPQGRFSLTGLGGGNLILTARHQAEAAVLGPESLENGGRKEVTIRLGPGASVAGAVSWDDGPPSAAAMVMVATNLGDVSRLEIETPTYPDGTFAVRGILPGEISLRAVPRGRRVDERRAEPGLDQASLTLKPGEQRTGLKLVVRH